MAKIINAWRTPSRDCLIVISESKVLVASSCLSLVCTEIELIYLPPQGNPLNRLTFSKFSSSNNIIWAVVMTPTFCSLCESNLHIFRVHYFLPLITLWNWRTYSSVVVWHLHVGVWLCAYALAFVLKAYWFYPSSWKVRKMSRKDLWHDFIDDQAHRYHSCQKLELSCGRRNHSCIAT